MDLDKAIQSRRSVRKFKEKKPDWRDILECVDAVRYAPASGNNFIMKFIVVDEKEKIKELADAAQQAFVSQVHYVVVALSKDDRIKTAFGEERGETYSRQQAGAAIQNFLLKIHEKGLATCWIGHLTEDHVRRILRIPGNMKVEAIFPVGYSNEKENKEPKIDIDRILFFNKWDNKKMKPPKTINI